MAENQGPERRTAPKRPLQFHPAFFICGLIVLAVVGAVATWNVVQLMGAIHIQQRQVAFKNELKDLGKTLQQIESDEQYFFATGHPEYLERLYRAYPLVQLQKEELEYVLDEATDQKKNLEILNYLLNRKLDILGRFIQQGQSPEDRARILSHMRSPEYRRLMEDLKTLINTMETAEVEAVSRHQTVVDRYSLISMIAIILGVIVAMVLVALFGFLMWREMRRRSLVEMDLLQAQEAAVISSRLKSQFLATVSHEIRTPLNGIIGLSDLLRDRIRGSEEKRLLEIIHGSGKSLLRVVNDILDFSKIEAGRIDFEIQKFGIEGVIHSAIELHSVRARQKGLYLGSYTDPALPAALAGDSSRILQILNNIVANAVKFTQSGSVVLRAQRLGSEDNKVWVRISVEDTGPGIPKPEQKYLFQPFNQLGMSEQVRHEGTGLGLSISKNLVERMGGRIGVMSSQGSGSTFYFELPLAVQSSEPLAQRVDSVYKSVVYLGPSVPLAGLLRQYCHDSGVDFVHHESDRAEVSFALPSTEKGPILCLYHSETMRRPVVHTAETIRFVALSNRVEISSQDQGGEMATYLSFPLTAQKFNSLLNMRVQETPHEEEAHTAAKSADDEWNNEVTGDHLILVVDDNTTNQILTQSYLVKLGFRSHVASNGEEALDAISQLHYDVVLMDCRMPVMDGFQATAEIRRREGTLGQRTPIIAMTAHAMQGDKEKCLAAGMDDYLPKPFELSELRTVLRKWIKPKQQVDWDVLKDLERKTNAQVVERMISSYMITLAESLKEIDRGRDLKDLEKIRFHAHKLKSSSAILGALKLSDLCSEVEVSAEDKRLDDRKIQNLLASGFSVQQEMAMHQQGDLGAGH